MGTGDMSTGGIGTRRDETGLSTVGAALAGIVAVLVVVLGVVAVQMSGSGDEPDGTTASSGETSSTGDGWVATAKEAARAGYPAFVPAKVPGGWSVGAATYAPDTSWRLELTTASGASVTLEQRTEGEVPDIAGELVEGAAPAGTVDLRRYGTGAWDAFEGDGGYALGKRLAGTAVVVAGVTEDEVVELTQQLLTAEMSVNVGDGSDG